jgi:hypothetical protein
MELSLVFANYIDCIKDLLIRGFDQYSGHCNLISAINNNYPEWVLNLCETFDDHEFLNGITINRAKSEFAVDSYKWFNLMSAIQSKILCSLTDAASPKLKKSGMKQIRAIYNVALNQMNLRLTIIKCGEPDAGEYAKLLESYEAEVAKNSKLVRELAEIKKIMRGLVSD